MGRCALVVGESGGYAPGACKILSPTGGQIERICPMSDQQTNSQENFNECSLAHLHEQRERFLRKLAEVSRKARRSTPSSPTRQETSPAQPK
jgi:hypothetical protein